MTVADLYRVLVISEEVIIKDYNKNFMVVYKGKAVYIPPNLFESYVKWVGSSRSHEGALELVIDRR